MPTRDLDITQLRDNEITAVRRILESPKYELIPLKNVMEQLVPDDTWWTQHVIAKGNHIIIKVNDKVVVDYTDANNTHTKGHMALQQHDPGSVVHYKNLMVKPLK